MDKLNPLELKFGGNVDLEKRVEVSSCMNLKWSEEVGDGDIWLRKLMKWMSTIQAKGENST
jgi:hypothetical protein